MIRRFTVGIASELSTQQAADTLGVSAPTVRVWAQAGTIAGRRVTRHGRQVWRLDEDSIVAVAAARSRAEQSQSTLASLAARVAALESRARSTSDAATAPSTVDALTLRAIVAGQVTADDARAAVIKHLLAALAAGEQADAHRRSAIAAAETALGYKLVPEDASGVEDVPQG